MGADDAYLGDIQFFAFGFAPRGWLPCNGQLLPINQNQALFSLLGTTYGGNGQTTFALPDLRGRAPMHVGPGATLGAQSGEEAHTLVVNELPVHVHQAVATAEGANAAVPAAGTHLATVDRGTFGDAYADPTAVVLMDQQAVAGTGGSQPHTNLEPYLTLNACIRVGTDAAFPSRN